MKQVKEVSEMTKLVYSHVYEMPRIGKYIETEIRLVIAERWRVWL